MAHLDITLQRRPQDRAAATDVCRRCKEPFLQQIEGAVSKPLLEAAPQVRVCTAH